MPAAPPFLIPYENDIGATPGDQFQLGPLIRQESDGDVYSVESLNEPTRNLEAKAYTLSGLSKSQRKAAKKRRQKYCFIDHAGKKFIVYPVDGQSPHDKEQQQQPKLQALDVHSSHKGPMRPTVAQLHRSPMIGAADEIETRKDEPKTGVVRGSKQLTPNLGDGDAEAAGSSHVTDVRTHRQKTHITKQGPELPTMKVAESSPENNVVKKKKRKKRNRGLKKAKVPRFATFAELESFLAIIGSRLTIQRRKLSTGKQILENGLYSVTESQEQQQSARHKRMAKTIAATQRQYDALSSRLGRARNPWEYLQLFRRKISDDVYRRILNQPYGVPWKLEFNKKPSLPWPRLLDYYKSYNLGGLDGLVQEREMEVEGILNGEE